VLNFEEDIAKDIKDDASADGRTEVEDFSEEEQEDDSNNEL
jgi:hypothetical protein